MDPYLESLEISPDFHDSFITYLREALQANLPAPYFAALGWRVWIEVSRGSIGPDLEVRHVHVPSPRRPEPTAAMAVADLPVARPVIVKVAHDEFCEPFVEIYTRGEEGKRLVASVEVLSLANKTPGEHGRDLYRKKQRELLDSRVHLVEIDFLRGGEHATAVPLEAARDACGPFDYHVSVRPFDDLDTFHVYPIRLGDRLPPIAIPLLPGDPPVTLDLQAVFDRCYDAGPYAREVRYGVDAVVPPLGPDRAAWAERILGAEAK
jgi:hypothetical protein